MATNVAGDKARLLPLHALGYIYRGGPNDADAVNCWNYNSSLILPPVPGSPFNQRIFSISAGILVGTIPQGAWIENVEVYVLTPFNAGSSNNLMCGTVQSGTLQANLPATFQNLVAIGDVNSGVVGNTVSGRNLGPSLCLTSDQDVYIQYQQTGTPATQGSALLLITFAGMMG